MSMMWQLIRVVGSTSYVPKQVAHLSNRFIQDGISSAGKAALCMMRSCWTSFSYSAS